MEKISSPVDLIRKSLETFFEKNNLVYFLKIYIWLLPFQAFFLYQTYFINTQSKILNTTNVQEIAMKYPWFLALVILVNLAFLIVSFWVDLAGIKAIFELSGKKNKSAKELFTNSKKTIWPFALLSILLGLIQLGGTILLIIPGVVFSVWFGFAKFVFVDKNTDVVASLKASKRLVEGKFWPILGRSAVFVIFTIVFQMIFTFVPYGIGSAISQLFGALIILPYYFLYKEISG